MPPGLRKATLTAHVLCSVGWFGSVTSFLVLAVLGMTTREGLLARAAYMAMGVIAGGVIVPLNMGALVTGVVQSLGTKWGLFRHYWVLIKLLITVLSTLLLQVHVQPIDAMAHMAARSAPLGPELQGLRLQLVVDAGAALMMLGVATALSVFKPRGLTPYGWRQQRMETQP